MEVPDYVNEDIENTFGGVPDQDQLEAFASLIGWILPELRWQEEPNAMALMEYLGLWEPPPPTYWVNVYELDRHYGGPEEGGWWYDSGTVLHSIKIGTDRDRAEMLRDALAVAHPAKPVEGPSLYSVGYRGGSHQVMIEVHEGKDLPTERPHYE